MPSNLKGLYTKVTKQLISYRLLVLISVNCFLIYFYGGILPNITVPIFLFLFFIEKNYYFQYISLLVVIIQITFEKGILVEGVKEIVIVFFIVIVMQLLSENKKLNVRNFQLNIIPKKTNYHGKFRKNARMITLVPVLMIFFDVDTFSILLVQKLILLLAVIELIGYILYKYMNRFSKIQPIVQSEVYNLQPEFCIYFTAPRGSFYQIMMWLEFLEKVELPFFILCREGWHLKDFEGRTNVPIVVAPKISDLDNYLPKSLKAIFYTNNSIRNCQMVRYWNYTHIQLLHGESDKPSSHNPVTNMFDYIFVAGQAAIDRYINHGNKINDEKFRIVGRPQLSKIEITQKIEEKVLLYAPTWIGFSNDANYCSLPFAFEIIQNALEMGYTIIFRHHPYSLKDQISIKQILAINDLLQKDALKTNRKHLYSTKATNELSVIDCINLSSVMISDNSSVVVDYLYSEKPFALVDVMNVGNKLEEELPISKGAYILDTNLNNLKNLLEIQFITDPKKQDRLEVKKYYLGDIAHNVYENRFIEVAKSLIV